MTMRLFAAVVPPADVLDSLDAFVEPRRDADANLRWVSRENWHLTLAFFGDVPQNRFEPLQSALDALSTAPFPITLDGAGTFPDPSMARVLYHAVTSGSAELSALSRKVRTAADRIGVPSDNAKHVPHLTLARLRRPGDVTRWLRIVDSFPQLSFPVTTLTLFRSELRPAGPIYAPLHTVALGTRPQIDAAAVSSTHTTRLVELFQRR